MLYLSFCDEVVRATAITHSANVLALSPDFNLPPPICQFAPPNCLSQLPSTHPQPPSYRRKHSRASADPFCTISRTSHTSSPWITTKRFSAWSTTLPSCASSPPPLLISFCASWWSPESTFLAASSLLFAYIIWDLNQIIAASSSTSTRD